MDFRYNAFISYRHSELDMFVAKKIHKGLETFKVPGSVAKATGIKKINRVFRDQEELPIGSDLDDNISAAIKASEFLIVICSPRTPGSEWVQKEISSFISYHGREHILAVLVEGEPGESFPQALLVDDEGNPVEPLAADVRGINNREVEKKLKTELLRLAAPILGCNYDDLRQRHRERRNRKIFAISAAILSVLACIGIGFGIYYAHNATVLKKALDEKQINHSKFLASESQAALEAGDRETAMLLAREALPYNKDVTLVPSAMNALSNALGVYEIGKEYRVDRQLTSDFTIKEAVYDLSGEYITVTDVGEIVSVWEAATGNKLLSILPTDTENPMGYSVIDANFIDNKLVVISTIGIFTKDLSQNIERITEENGYGSFGKIDISNRLAAAEYGDSLYIFDLTDFKEIQRIQSDDSKRFYTGYAFSNDGKYLAVPHLENDSAKGIIEVYSVEDGSSKVFETPTEYIMKTRFLQNGDLVTLSVNEDDLFDLTSKHKVYLQCFDVKGNTQKWSREIDALGEMFDTNVTNLLSRIYQDSDGVSRNEIILSMNNEVYTFDGNNGNILSELGFSNVTNLFLNATSSFAYIVKNDGLMEFADLMEKSVYDTYAIDTNMAITKAIVAKERIALFHSLDTAVTIFSRPVGKNMETFNLADSTIAGIECSKDSSLIVVSEFSDVFHFINQKSGEEILTISDDEALDSAFVSESEYLIIHKDASFKFVNVRTGQEEIVKPGKEYSYASRHLIDAKNNRALAGDGLDYTIIDTSNHKIVIESVVGGTKDIYDFKNMKEYFFLFEEDALYKGDILSEEISEMGLNDIDKDIFRNSLEMYLSPKGNYIAMTYPDMTIRIVNTNTMMIDYTFEFYYGNSLNLAFSEDETKLYLQGADNLFKIYNFKTGSYEFISTEAYQRFVSIVESPDDKLLFLRNYQNFYILDLNTMSIISTARNGAMYDPINKEIWAYDSYNVYRFKYMELNDLLAESERQFPDASLTEVQRLKYFVD